MANNRRKPKPKPTSRPPAKRRPAARKPRIEVLEIPEPRIEIIEVEPPEWVPEPRLRPPEPKPVPKVAMVQARAVSKIYNSKPSAVIALDSVDLVLGRGEMVAVMGPSGSGKTTLLNCLSGLDEISSGEVIVEGESLGRMSDGQRTGYRARRMGFVFQAFNLLPVFSAVENVELPLLLGGTRVNESRRRAREALDSVGLADRARHRPGQLSSGEQQRVAIARAIAPEPAVLWADEPTGNLDTENAEKIIHLIKQLNVDRDLTILMVTHDHHMASWADQLLQMKDGRITG